MCWRILDSRRRTADHGANDRYLAAPVLCLSAISVLLVAVLRDMNAYNHGAGPAFGAWALWGGLVCVAVLVLLLAGASLGLAPLATGQPVSLNGTVPATLILGVLWVFFSIVSATLWPLSHALDSIGLPAPGLRIGPILLANLLLVLAFVVALMVLVLPAGRLASKGARNQKLVMASLLVTVTAFGGGYALFAGVPPLLHWLGDIRT